VSEPQETQLAFQLKAQAMIMAENTARVMCYIERLKGIVEDNKDLMKRSAEGDLEAIAKYFKNIKELDRCFGALARTVEELESSK
jgi:glutamate synthase domain-containing protein 2